MLSYFIILQLLGGIVLEISTLKKQPQHIQAVSNMIYKEFVLHTASTKSLKDVENFFWNTKEDSLPISFIAVIDGKCVGTVSIFESDLAERPEYKPWLASLYVEPQYRSQKVGQQLITYLIHYIQQLGYDEVYLKTKNASEYYKKRGWGLVESVKINENEVVDIFKYKI